MDIRTQTAAAAIAIAMITLFKTSTPACAGESLNPVRNNVWQTECASCHVAYPPQLLPAASWKRLMAGLDRHFGTNASIEPGAAQEIGAFLEANAARGKRAERSAGALRVTETAWFRHEHGEVPERAWSRAEVRSRSNCTACHSKADRGDFSESGLWIAR